MFDTLEHAAAFGINHAGLERLLRFIQSIFLILTSYPSLLTSIPIPLSLPALLDLQPHLNIVRQWIRLFWFVESFQASYSLYASSSYSSSPMGTRQWLDVVSNTCFGIYGLAESVTVWDATGVAGTEVWDKKWYEWLMRDALVYWFVGLLTSVMSALVQLGGLYVYRPVPQPGLISDLGENEKKKMGRESQDVKKKKKRLRQKQDESRKRFIKERNALMRKFAADGLDMVIPAACLGWMKVEDGMVGVVMAVTSILTGWSVWDGVGMEVKARKRSRQGKGQHDDEM